MAVLAHEELLSDLRTRAPDRRRSGSPNRHYSDHNQLTNEILRLDTCTSFEQVHTALLSISASLGFDAFLYRGRFQTGGNHLVEHIESNYPCAWRKRYDKERYDQIDPAVAHACASLSPLLWSDAAYDSCAQKLLREEARQHGLVEGVTFPVHSRNGDVGMLNLSLARSDDAARQHTRAMLNWGALLAAMTHETMARIVKDKSASQSPKLTRREAEVLRWIAEGKSNWEIARLVEITEHGVSYHVRNILLKFDVGSRHRAVARAHVFGLL